jgi:hypothetical protein
MTDLNKKVYGEQDWVEPHTVQDAGTSSLENTPNNPIKGTKDGQNTETTEYPSFPYVTKKN